MFESCEYRVDRIDGDYAFLCRTDGAEGDLKMVARALLPAEVEEGSCLLYEMMEYRIIE
ncbi:chorismate--pyruvate lyase [Anaerolentibacter hominis]|uniref:chorismate--pyruvate lyase n=1 Tax=Anaerolentibacter hominis TaxID=3079009 RepID=UPI0031B883DA